MSICGRAVAPSGERAFRRFVIWAAGVAFVVLAVAGIFLSIRSRHSITSQIERMELDVSRSLEALLRTRDGDDLLAPVEAVDATVTRWRKTCAKWKGVKFSMSDREKILRLQRLQDSSIRRWRDELNSMDSASLKRENILQDVLREQSLWPPPPPPPIILAFSDGVRDFANGAMEGATWPWLVGRRAYAVGARPGKPHIGQATRFILFPHRMSGLSFALVFGFGLAAVFVGYGLCHAGMRANAVMLCLFGLVYFIYVVIFAVFLGLLFFRLVE